MGWLGDSTHRGQGCQAWTAVGLPPRYPQLLSGNGVGFVPSDAAADMESTTHPLFWAVIFTRHVTVMYCRDHRQPVLIRRWQSFGVGVIGVLQFCNLCTPISLEQRDTLPPMRVADAGCWVHTLISLQLGPFVNVAHGSDSLSAAAVSVRVVQHFRYGRTVTRSRAAARKPNVELEQFSAGFRVVRVCQR